MWVCTWTSGPAGATARRKAPASPTAGSRRAPSTSAAGGLRAEPGSSTWITAIPAASRSVTSSARARASWVAVAAVGWSSRTKDQRSIVTGPVSMPFNGLSVRERVGGPFDGHWPGPRHVAIEDGRSNAARPERLHPAGLGARTPSARLRSTAPCRRVQARRAPRRPARPPPGARGHGRSRRAACRCTRRRRVGLPPTWPPRGPHAGSGETNRSWWSAAVGAGAGRPPRRDAVRVCRSGGRRRGRAWRHGVGPWCHAGWDPVATIEEFGAGLQGRLDRSPPLIEPFGEERQLCELLVGEREPRLQLGLEAVLCSHAHRDVQQRA